MAERNSTSKARSGRKLSAVSKERRPRASRTGAQLKDRAARLTLKNSVENARRQLMRADAVLGCISFAFMYSDRGEVDVPDYADAVGVARGLVSESIHALDPVSLRLT
jgi:hypothetical protein